MQQTTTVSQKPQKERNFQNENYCTFGYKLSLNGDNCVDIDECAENIHSCEPKEKCMNEAGSYRCESFLEESTTEVDVQRIKDIEKTNEVVNKNKISDFESTDDICPLGFFYSNESKTCEGNR